MDKNISSNVWNALMCPNCGGALYKSTKNIVCNSCESQYGYTESGSPDLRLHHPKTFKFEFKLGTPLFLHSSFDFDVLPLNPTPEVDFSGIDTPHHLSREILSHFPKAESDHSLMIDLGCGNTIHQEVCEHAGFEYVGLDYANDKAPFLGDAHALPFKDESIDFILSIAVLEHIRYPFVMMKEVYRVLKPSSTFIGTVAFLEPFHGNSFYHHTHLGTYNSLQEGGFSINYICPNKKWSVLVAQASMGLFPRMPIGISKALVAPLQILHRIWWKIGGYFSNIASEGIRINKTTGAFTFIARK